MKLQLKLAEQEMKLEELRLQTITQETEKMRLELEQSKQILIESQQRLNYTKSDWKTNKSIGFHIISISVVDIFRYNSFTKR